MTFAATPSSSFLCFNQHHGDIKDEQMLTEPSSKMSLFWDNKGSLMPQWESLNLGIKLHF